MSDRPKESEPQSDDRDRRSEASALPLDYRVPRDERPRLHPAVPLIAGVVGGAAMVVCAGAWWFLNRLDRGSVLRKTLMACMRDGAYVPASATNRASSSVFLGSRMGTSCQ